MSKLPDMSPAALHSAGAAVIHEAPFKALEVVVDYEHPSPEFIERWIRPFYVRCLTKPSELEDSLRQVFPHIDEPLVRKLLAYFDWRPRVVGSFFAALCGFAQLTDDIGRLLLRSDVCDAGVSHCFALARFNNPPAVQYLRDYLDHYLRRPELWFDQSTALQALQFLDEKNHTTYAQSLGPLWREFVANKPNSNPAPTSHGFAGRMKVIDDLAARLRGTE